MQNKVLQALVLVTVVSEIYICTATGVFYVLPDNPCNVSCPSQPCATLSQYLLDNNGTLPVVSNVEYHFLPGEHHLHNKVTLKYLNNFTLVGDSIDNLSKTILISCFLSFVKIDSSQCVKIVNVMFKQCEAYYQQTDHYEDGANLILYTCYSCNTKSVTFFEYGISAYNLIGNSSLKNITITVTESTIMLKKISLDQLYLITLEYWKVYWRNFAGVNMVEMNEILITGHGIGGIILGFYPDHAMHVVISNSEFQHMNKQVLFFDGSSLAKVSITNCVFSSNQYSLEFRQVAMIQFIVDTGHSTISFINCTFQYNFYWESLLSVRGIDIHQSLLPTNIIIQDCKFNYNLSPLLYFDGSSTANCILTLTIVGTTSMTLNRFSGDIEYSILYIKNTAFNIHGLVMISENIAHNNYIMLFESSEVSFSGEIIFNKNQCKRIIAIKEDPSYVKVMENTKILCNQNHVYSKSILVLELDNSNNHPYPFCTFQYVTMNNVSTPSTTDYVITIEKNLYILQQHGSCELQPFLTHCRWLNTSVFYGHNPGVIN